MSNEFNNNSNMQTEIDTEMKQVTTGGAGPRDATKIYGVYIDSLLTKKVVLSITEIGKNIKENLQRKLANSMEGKCIEEGFIRPGSIKIETYSSGLVNTENIEFQTVFTCKICHPVEGMLIECTSKTITKAGIHAQVIDRDVIPLTVFVARDHHNMDKYFQSIKENMKILVKVIGIRYELNDPYICVLAKLVKDDQKISSFKKSKKAAIAIGGDVDTDDDEFEHADGFAKNDNDDIDDNEYNENNEDEYIE